MYINLLIILQLLHYNPGLVLMQESTMLGMKLFQAGRRDKSQASTFFASKCLRNIFYVFILLE